MSRQTSIRAKTRSLVLVLAAAPTPTATPTIPPLLNHWFPLHLR